MLEGTVALSKNISEKVLTESSPEMVAGGAEEPFLAISRNDTLSYILDMTQQLQVLCLKQGLISQARSFDGVLDALEEAQQG